MKVTIDSLSKAVEQELQTYKKVTTERLKETVREVAHETKALLQYTPPKKSGKYAKSWTIKVNYDSSHALSVVVYSKNRYQLTHLLEFGHAKRGGGRTKAYPHITVAEEKAIRLFEKKIQEIVEG